MNILSMLEMYLQEHDINCSVVYHNDRWNWSQDISSLTVHLKHSITGQVVNLSIAQVKLYIKGAEVWGRPPNDARHREAKEIKLADLADPQAFERVRLWIRYQEKAMRQSVKFKNVEVISQLHGGPEHVKVAIKDNDISFISSFMGLDLDNIVEDIGPRPDAYDIPPAPVSRPPS